MLPSFATQTITRARATTSATAHGNADPNWSTATETDIPGCSVEPGATAETLTNRDTTLIEWTVFAPAGTDLLSTDRVRYLGIIYLVDGEPARWTSPTGALSHLEINLKRWEG